MDKLRLILSSILMIIFIILACFGVVYSSFIWLQLLCVVIALIASMTLKMLFQHLSR